MTRTIQPQDPSASPTFNLSQANPATVNGSAIPSSLRRNLFSSHLSRRPVASQGTSSSDTLPDPFQATPVAFPRQNSQPSYNIFTQLQPSLSPTSTSQHPTQPSPSHSAAAVSPKRQHSSAHPHPQTQQIQPAPPSQPTTSILTLDPTTNRPILPTLPTLPARLHISSDDEDDPDPDEDDDPDAHLQEVHRHHQSDYAHMQPPASMSNIDFSSSTSAFTHPHTQHIGPNGGVLTDIIDTTSDPDYGSYERIERVLSEMQAQQRARARQLPPSTTDSSTNWSVGHGVSTRSRGKTKNAGMALDVQSVSGGKGGGVGATIPQHEKEELLGLIMTSLGKKVAVMEGEGWMFGEENAGCGGVEVGSD